MICTVVNPIQCDRCKASNAVCTLHTPPSMPPMTTNEFVAAIAMGAMIEEHLCKDCMESQYNEWDGRY